MIDNQPLHKAQISILEALRHNNAMRFSDLMRPTGLISDTFKFHIRKLVHAGIVEKQETGEYRLTQRGKEIANTINRETRVARKQPKVSVLLVISRLNADNVTEYLVQQRLRNPFYGYWGFPSGPIDWGEEAEQAAQRELQKQTGAQASFSVRAFYRERDFDSTRDKLMEDKLFTVLSGTVNSDVLADWAGGHNTWMTAQELQNQERFFGSCIDIIAMLESGQSYLAQTVNYSPDEY